MKTIFLLLIVCSSVTAFAQSNSRFTITRSVVASGGTTFSTGSRFQLGSTIAQPLAAVPGSSRFSIQGGFWTVPTPAIFAPAKSGSDFVFSFQTELGSAYVVEYTDSLSPANWQPLVSLLGDGTAKSVIDSVSSIPQRFYRLKQQ